VVDLTPLHDVPADLRVTSLDLLPVRDVPPGLADTMLDLAPVPDMPGPGLADTVLDLPAVCDTPAVNLTETSYDLIPVRDVPPPGLADTALDLVPVPDAPAGERVPAEPADWPGALPEGVVEHPAQTAAAKTVASPASGPQVARRPARAGGGAHAGRPMGGTRGSTGRLADPRRLAAPRRVADRPPAGRPSRNARAAQRTPAWRPSAGDCAAAAAVVTAVPLCLLQLPYAALPLADTAAAQASGPAAVLRITSLALPFAVAAAPLAALAIRRLRAWPLLLAGVLAIVAGDGLAALDAPSAAASGRLAAFVGALHGIGAALAMLATVALVTERAVVPRRLLATWWAAVTVAALAVLPGMNPGRPAAGLLTLFGPVPWLTATALAAALLYPVLSGSTRLFARQEASETDPADRTAAGPYAADRASADRASADRASADRASADRAAAASPIERDRLALLAPPAAALGVFAVAATFRPGDTIVIAAICGVAALFVLAAVATRGVAGDGFAVLCAVAGFVVAPASAALASLRAIASAGAPAGAVAPGLVLGGAAVAGAVLGAAVTLAARRDGEERASARIPRASARARLAPVAGLLLVAAALVAASFAGPFAGTAVLSLLIATVTGGMAAALAGPVGRAAATAAGGMAGMAVLVAGALAGYLAAGAIRVQLAGVAVALTGAGPVTGTAAVPQALVTAIGWWELAGAVIAVAVVFVQCGRREPGTPARREPRHDRHRANQRIAA
jgi:hypothetical protein